MGHLLDEWMARGHAEFKGTGRVGRGRNPLKSYLVEANVPDFGEQPDGVAAFFAKDGVSVRVEVERGNDPTLHRIDVGQVSFFLDTLDPRFWLLHSTNTAEATDAAIRALVRRTPQLDSAWLPSRHLERWSGELGVPRGLTAKFSTPTRLDRDDLPDDPYLDDSLLLRIGSSGDARVRWQGFRDSSPLAPSLALWSARIVRRGLDRDHVVVGDVTADGKVTSRGDSFRLHQELLGGLKDRYAQLIRGWEERFRLGWGMDGSGAKPTGDVAELPLPVPLDEDESQQLLDKLFDGREPFRLYGVPVRQGARRYVARGVDLHTGDKVDFEIGPDMLRVYLFPSTCGNVLARLLTNLQHYHDARVDLA
jgi:hypothetical protein